MLKRTALLVMVFSFVCIKSDYDHQFLSNANKNNTYILQINHGTAFGPFSQMMEQLNNEVIWRTESQEVISAAPVKFKVVIDPGHGGDDVGAISVDDRYEKDFNLVMALKVQELLKDEPNIDLYLTRWTDNEVALNDRIAMANDLPADVFLSIHANIDEWNRNTKGTKTFFNREDSIPFTEIIQKHVQKATGFRDLLYDIEEYRVIKNTTMPAALLEVGFLSNAAEEKELYNESNQDRYAKAIVEGIQEYLSTIKLPATKS